jgi:hypothetical protein
LTPPRRLGYHRAIRKRFPRFLMIARKTKLVFVMVGSLALIDRKSVV